MTETNTASSLKIEEHDFQQAKKSLKLFTEEAQKDVGLSTVSPKGGLFKLVNHKVTGKELNMTISEIQDHLIHFNKLSQNFVNEFVQVYHAFESLDKDYIAGIVTAIKAAEEVSKREQQDRKDIKRMIEQHELSVRVLRNFKEDIDKIKHLTDIDEAWNILERQTQRLDEFHAFMTKLSQMEHIEDIDTLWDSYEALRKADAVLHKSVELQGRAIAGFDRTLEQAQEGHQQFMDGANQLLAESREDFTNQVTRFTEAQRDKLAAMEEQLDQRVDNWRDKQLTILESMATEQERKWAEKEKRFDEEKAALVEQTQTLAQKVKMSQLVAGGAAALTAVQLLLTLLGVL